MKRSKLSLLVAAITLFVAYAAVARSGGLTEMQPTNASSIAHASPEVITLYKFYFGGKGDKKIVLDALAEKLAKNKDVLEDGNCEISKNKRNVKHGVPTAYSCTSPNEKTDKFFRSVVAMIIPTTKPVPELSLRAFTYALPPQGIGSCIDSSLCCAGEVVLCKGFPRNRPCTVCPE